MKAGRDVAAMAEQCESTAQVLKVLAHPQRLQLLCHLSEGERTVSDLERLCQASQSQLSQFLQRMKSEGLVSFRRDGKFVFYSVADPKVLKLIQALHKIFCP
jgi:ArsR family transcriptional regulator, virulence genes transcriptional regulator